MRQSALEVAGSVAHCERQHVRGPRTCCTRSADALVVERRSEATKRIQRPTRAAGWVGGVSSHKGHEKGGWSSQRCEGGRCQIQLPYLASALGEGRPAREVGLVVVREARLPPRRGQVMCLLTCGCRAVPPFDAKTSPRPRFASCAPACRVFAGRGQHNDESGRERVDAPMSPIWARTRGTGSVKLSGPRHPRRAARRAPRGDLAELMTENWQDVTAMLGDLHMTRTPAPSRRATFTALTDIVAARTRSPTPLTRCTRNSATTRACPRVLWRTLSIRATTFARVHRGVREEGRTRGTSPGKVGLAPAGDFAAEDALILVTISGCSPSSRPLCASSSGHVLDCAAPMRIRSTSPAARTTTSCVRAHDG